MIFEVSNRGSFMNESLVKFESLIKADAKYNFSEAQLVECALKANDKTYLSADGALVITTGLFTGRAAKDKYVVEDSYSEKVIDWQNNINKMSSAQFDILKLEMLKRFECKDRPIYVNTRSASADPDYALEVNLITTSAAHALFALNIFRDEVHNYPLGSFTIMHDPDFMVDIKKNEVRSPTVIAINFSTREVIIAGTGYAGEIKKAIFSILNTLLPDYGILPMHTGANKDKEGNTSLFFGLSGTGKTTLSTDIEVDLIGDDEHGLSEAGIFNFEGGCYAKTDGLNQEKEPDIYLAANSFKSLLENVVLDPETRRPKFNDTSITENGRATYSLKVLNHIVKDSRGGIPSNIFFLSADALGVLPAVSLLTVDQALYYYLSGYTAKLAGTELGLKGIEIAFSHCFGAPFMMRKAEDYSKLLRIFLDKYPIKVWLINTGWYGGKYGTGKRYPLAITRNCIRSIQSGQVSDEFNLNEVFNLKTPKSLVNLDPKFLQPENLWSDKEDYFKTALDLKDKFEENHKKFIGII